MTGISLIFDLKKLRRYFTPQVKVEIVKDGNIHQHKGDVRECTSNDFRHLEHVPLE